MTVKCKKAFINGTLLFGPRGGEYILVKPRNNKGTIYKKYCKFKENNKRKMANNVMKGYRPKAK